MSVRHDLRLRRRFGILETRSDAAKQIADQLVKLGVEDAKPMLSAGKAIPLQLEIWFARPQIRQVDPRALVMPVPSVTASP